MRMRDQFALAFGNLRRRKMRSFLTISAVVVGAMSVIVMLTLVLGAKRAFVKQVKSMDALTLVSVNGDPNSTDDNLFSSHGGGDTLGKKLDDRTVAKLRAIPHVTAAAPVASMWARGMTLDGSSKRIQPNITTYDPAANVFKLPLAAGRMLKPGEKGAIVLGASALRGFGYRGQAAAVVGRSVQLLFDGSNYYNDYTGNPPLPPQGGDQSYFERMQKEIRPVSVRVVGVAAPGPNDDSSFVTMSFARALMTQRRWEFDQKARDDFNRSQQNMRGPMPQQQDQSAFMRVVRDDQIAKQGYGGIMLRVDSTEAVKAVATEVARLGYGVTSAQQMLDGISKLFLILGLIAGAIGGISLFVAAIGIINTMVMATLERTREVGVMRALGATRATILRMFSIEAAMIGALGGAIALAGSFALTKIAGVLLGRVATAQGVPLSDVLAFPLWMIVGVLSLTAFVGFAAGILPAQRAARLDPVEALRYE